MTLRMMFAPLTFAALAFLMVYAQSDLPCVLMLLAKIATNISL